MTDASTSRAGSIRRDWAVTTAATVLVGSVIFVAAPVAATRLGPEGRGTLVTVQLLPQLLANLASVGLGFAIIHFGAKRPSSARALWRWSLRRCAAGAAATWILGQILAPLITDAGDDERMLRIYLLLCPLLAFTAVPLEMLRALGRFVTWNAFTFLNQVLWPVVLLIGVLRPVPSLWLVVWLHLAATALVLLLLIWVGLRVTRDGSDEPVTDRPEFLRYGLKSALSTIPTSANAKLDQLVMAAFISTSDLGLYAAAAGWSQLTLPVMRGLIAVSMPFVSGAADTERAARVRRLTTLGAGSVVLLGVAGGLATLVLWAPLYGEAFRPALPAALVLMVAGLLLQYNAVLGNILRSLDRPGLVTGIESSVLVLSVAALIAVLQFSPVLGAAVVSLLTYLTAAIAYGSFIAARTDQHMSQLIDLRGAAVLARQMTDRLRGGSSTSSRGEGGTAAGE
jgi:O-antigen/teichoic acid export membrane protein